MNSVREIDIKNRMYYLLDHMINIKYVDLSKLNIDEIHTKTFLFTIKIL